MRVGMSGKLEGDDPRGPSNPMTRIVHTKLSPNKACAEILSATDAGSPASFHSPKKAPTATKRQKL